MQGFRRIPAGEEFLLREIDGAGAVVERVPLQQGQLAVLFAFQIGNDGLGRFRVVLVDGRIGGAANEDQGIGRIPDQHHHETQGRQVGRGPPSLVRVPYAKSGGGHDEQRKQHGTPGLPGYGRQILHDAGIYDQKNDHGNTSGPQDAPPALRHAPGGLVDFRKINDEGNIEYRQQVEQMHPDGKAHQIGNEHKVAVRVPSRRALVPGDGPLFLAGFLAPFHNQPHHEGRKAHGQAVYFRLDGVEPERIRGGERDGAHDAARQRRNAVLGGRILFAPFLHMPFADEPDDNQVREEHRNGAGQHGHEIYRKRHVRCGREHRKEAPDQHVEWGARRVGHLEQVGDGDKFARIPERGRRRYGKPVQREREQKNGARNDSMRGHGWRTCTGINILMLTPTGGGRFMEAGARDRKGRGFAGFARQLFRIP